jgi:hypothetical protein
MSLPGNMVTLTGQYYNLDGTPAAGQVTFALTQLLTDTADAVSVVPQTITAKLSGGAFSVTLLATDNGQYSPAEWVYQVTEQIGPNAPLANQGGFGQPPLPPPGRVYQIALPHSLGANQELSHIAPAVAGTEYTTYMLVGDYAAGTVSVPAEALIPTFATGTASQLSDQTVDYTVYLQIGTAGTEFSIAIGPTSTPAYVIVGSSTPVAGSTHTFRLPAGWYVEVAGIGSTWAATAISC